MASSREKLFVTLFNNAKHFLMDYDATYKVNVDELRENRHRATYLINRYFTQVNHMQLANTSKAVDEEEEEGDVEQLTIYDNIEEEMAQQTDDSISDGDNSNEDE